MAYWLVKADPDEYGAERLALEKRTAWTGIKNPTAQRHLRNMKKGDGVLLYHTGGEKAVVATAKIVKAPYADAADVAGKRVGVDLQFAGWLKRQVTLREIKSERTFAEFDLVRISRLSVMPVSEAHWRRLLEMAGGVSQKQPAP